METPIKVVKHSGGFFKLLFLLLLLIVLGAGFLVYKRSGRIDLSFIEKTPPVIILPEGTIGIGAETKQISITISDAGAGLDEAVIRIEQNGKSQDLLHKQFEPGTFNNTFTVDLPAKEKGLKEGDVTIKVSAFDRSFWNNSSSKQAPGLVSYSKPRVEVLTAQHNVAIGGVELVFYKVRGSNIKSSGVLIGDNVFEGSKASLLDPAFEKYPDINFAFFALPWNFNKDKDKISVFVEDAVGNRGSSTMYYLVIPRKYKDAEMKLSDDFMRKVFDELLPPYYKEINEIEPNYDFDKLTDQEKVAKFKLINESYRVLLLKKLAGMMKASEQKKLWSAPWSRPMSAAPTSTFAESRTYFLNNVAASSSLHAGVDLADVANAVVHAANAGKVVFADFLGIYGNAVLIDHGFGLSTLYGHLSSISVAVGDEVQRDAPLGRSGATGLAGGDHLHFEVRLHGVPVHPIEWWDGTWIREHIDKKIQYMMEQINSQAALDAQVSR